MKNAKSFFYNSTIAIVLIISIVFASLNFASAEALGSIVDNMNGSFTKVEHNYANLSNILSLPNGNSLTSLSQLMVTPPDDSVQFSQNPGQPSTVSYFINGAKEVVVGFYTTFSLEGYGDKNSQPSSPTYYLENPTTGGSYSTLDLHSHNGNLLIKCLYDDNFRQVTFENGSMQVSINHYYDFTIHSGDTTPIGVDISVASKDGTISSVGTYIKSSRKVGDGVFGPIYYHEATTNLSGTAFESLEITLTGFDHLTQDNISQNMFSVFAFASVQIEDAVIEQSSSSEETSSSSSQSEGSSGGSSSESSSSLSSESSSSESESSYSSSSQSESSIYFPSTSESYSSSEIDIPFPSIPQDVNSKDESSKVETPVSKAWEKDIKLPGQDDDVDENKLDWDDSLLIIDADTKEDDKETLVKESSEEREAIDTNTPELTPFIPALPLSLVNAQKPSLEKVVGSSLVVSASIGIYILFYKKMMAQ